MSALIRPGNQGGQGPDRTELGQDCGRDGREEREEGGNLPVEEEEQERRFSMTKLIALMVDKESSRNIFIRFFI